jgi:hypothetical protein
MVDELVWTTPSQATPVIEEAALSSLAVTTRVPSG